MTLQEMLEYEEQQKLNEGLVFSKQSKKLNKWADKVEKKLTSKMVKGSLTATQEKQIKEILSDIRIAAKEFENLEEKFKKKEIDRSKAKEQYEKLKNKHSGLLKKLKSDKIKKIFGVIGALGSIAGIIAGLNALGIGQSISGNFIPSGPQQFLKL